MVNEAVPATLPLVTASFSLGQLCEARRADVCASSFMHAFETQGLLKADPPRFGRRDEAKMLYEEDMLLIDRIRFDTDPQEGKCDETS